MCVTMLTTSQYIMYMLYMIPYVVRLHCPIKKYMMAVNDQYVLRNQYVCFFPHESVFCRSLRLRLGPMYFWMPELGAEVQTQKPEHTPNAEGEALLIYPRRNRNFNFFPNQCQFRRQLLDIGHSVSNYEQLTLL